jgi:hypothetical protein
VVVAFGVVFVILLGIVGWLFFRYQQQTISLSIKDIDFFSNNKIPPRSTYGKVDKAKVISYSEYGSSKPPYQLFYSCRVKDILFLFLS